MAIIRVECVGEPTKTAASGQERAKKRVLLADDYEPVLRQVEELLVADFDIVGLAHNGLQMIAAAYEFQPDVIVSDIEMPQMSGIEAVGRC
jgi:CheY-like chemotaxis protein